MDDIADRSAEGFDAIIIGCGPAGSAAAAALAQAGRSVLVLERREFPRFHIGESQLPYVTAALEEIGALGEVNAQGYVPKRGAEFIFPDGDYRRLAFADQGPGRAPVTFQCERAHFDNVLARHAQACGAELRQPAVVTDLLRDGDRVTGVSYTHGGKALTARAPYVIDAAGRASKISHAFGLRRTIDRLRMVAVFRQFTGLDEQHNPGYEGDIQIGGHRDGWIWAIPIWPRTISVGAVMPKAVLQAGTPESVFAEHLSRVPRITARLTGTSAASEVRAETDYCYYTDTLTGPGWFLAGDAGCFVDPIFSGGVFLALMTGIRAARAIDRILSEPDLAGTLQREYSSFYKTGYDTYTRLIYAYYESQYNLGRYLKNLGADVQGPWLIRLLSGDFWSQGNPIAEILRREQRWDIFAPFDRTLECPLYGDLDAAEQASPAISSASGAGL